MSNVALPQGWGILLVIWGAVGPLAGIVVGHFLTRSWQAKQWLLDRKNEEWRELITALSISLRASLKVYPVRPLDPSEQREIVEAHADCFRVIRDRLFIAKDVKTLNLENRWSEAVQHHKSTLDAAHLGKTYDGIRMEILVLATRIK